MKLKDIKTNSTKKYVLCSYTAKDGSVVKEKYYRCRLSEAKRSFLSYLKTNQLCD